MKQNWIFYGINNGVKILHSIKQANKPEKTKEYKKMMTHLDNYVYERVGFMTADAWNKENQFIKINADGQL